jgi:hypothetical protein
MSAVLDPNISEFDTEEQETSYDRWFRAKVQQALDSVKPTVPHDEAVARIQALLEQKRVANARRPLV